LAAVYRRGVLPAVETLLAADRLRPVFLFESVSTRLVQPEELIDVDPQLSTLENLNQPSDYLSALARAGFTAPAEVVEMTVRGPGRARR
jgi:molybdopterin-guanine dinucleotide biosynthesis protein A